ncbi:hypothetical protein [Actinokineospora sp.]|uniref:hypothetical protein n=1 Tax=Actinokineospora sp. TaxID=1872133 RepID=UPI0040384413
MDAPGHEVPRGRVAEWFPLVPRPRPPCRDLAQRVNEIRDLAHAASHGTHEDRIGSAAEAHNKAALILSDCDLPDLAHQLCWRQFDIFNAARPLTARTGKFALQPIVNLGRLLIRTGHGGRAYQVFRTIYDAMRTPGTTTIDGRTIDISGFVEGDEQRRELRKFLWAVLLADGTRALTTTGRWDDALRHVEQHKGIGTRMLDGRQVAVLARCATGDVDGAIDLLDSSATPEPWEKAVAAYLRLRTDHRPTGSAVAAMVNHYLQLDPAPQHAVFRTRLGLCVLDLASADNSSEAPAIATRVMRETVDSDDAYLAWDVLSHNISRLVLTEAHRRTLAATLKSSRLRHATMPTNLIDDLNEAVTTSEAHLTQMLESPRATTEPRGGARCTGNAAEPSRCRSTRTAAPARCRWGVRGRCRRG